ncbi:MAG: PAS domain S-box protein [Pseudomonadales bacterium]
MVLPPQQARSNPGLWLPLLIASMLALLSITAWHVLGNQQRAQLQTAINEQVNTLEALIKQDLDNRVHALNRLARRWALVGGTPRAIWESDVVNYLVDQPGYQAIEWADPSLKIRWIMPLEGNEAAQNLNLSAKSYTRAAPEAARDRRITSISSPIDLVQGGKGIVAYVPIVSGDEFDGLIIGVLRLQKWLDIVTAAVPESDYSVTVRIADQDVYQRAAHASPKDERWLQGMQFDLYGLQWHVQLWPTEQRLEAYNSPIVTLMLIAGLLLSGLIAYATHLAQTARYRARQLQQEIAAHRQLDEELRKSHELLEQRVAQRTAELSAYLESAPDAMLIVNQAGAVQLANAQATGLFEYAQEELHGMTVEALLPERFRKTHVKQRSDFLANAKARPMGTGMELFALTSAGREIPIEVSLSPITTESGRLVCAALRDITERKQAADELHAATQQLRMEKEFSDKLIQTQQGIVLILDAEHRITLCNPYFESLTGYTAAEILGQDWFPLFIPEGEREMLLAFFQKVVRAGINEGYTNAIVTRSGEQRLIRWHAKTMVDADGNFTGLLNTGYDVTEEQAAAELLRQAKDAAERANAAKSRFLATASHDLRQPLQSLNLLSSALGKTIDDPKAQKMLRMQGESLAGMSNLLNSLLDIGRLESGGVVPKLGAVAVGPVFERMRADFEQQAAEKGIELCIEPTAHIVHTDPDLLAQIILNLVANAIRYTRNGSVTLRSILEKDQLRIEVVDTGIGIPADQLHRIFDEFHQVERDPQQRNEGLGLGLAIVQRMVALLNTQIEVESEQGKGSRFAFTLPVSVAMARDSISGSVSDDAQGAVTGTVLLLDDDLAVLEASQLLLEIEGFDVAAATTSAAAYALLEHLATAPDIIVTDYHLGGAETGIDIVRAMRDRLGHTIPAILVTGDTSPSIGEFDIEDVQVLNKPIKANELLALLRQLLSALAN